MLKSVLIANRGEIACRIARTARRMGLRVIAVYSQADARAPHVRLADEAHLIGPAPARDSYLDAGKILRVAKLSGADCVHPGYGFLSENAEFAEACAVAGLVFVGPSPGAIRAMGLKDGAKALMQRAGVPIVPGYHGTRQEPRFLKEKAYETGYPVLVKAVAGGGGRGMRRVDMHADFDAALEGAQREALSTFGNAHVLIEKYIDTPRHIEMQVFGDSHGNVVHLFERDCSLQRRHQKVIEEAPAPGMSAPVRAAMAAAAIAAAKAVAYCGAGTVEFIADGSGALRTDGFYFMEMNTRLQVEHPVTEAVTGLDLVEWQFRVASGEALPLRQDEIACHGHAVEARLYAEDPEQGFLPSSGKLWALRFPAAADGLRIDSGVEAGGEVTPFYDPMIAKIIAHGATREAALDRLARALDETVVAGPRCNAAFLRALCLAPGFRSGAFDTGFIGRNLEALGAVAQPVDAAAVAAGVCAALQAQLPPPLDAQSDPWSARDAFQLGGERRVRSRIMADGQSMLATLSGGFADTGEGCASARIGLAASGYDDTPRFQHGAAELQPKPVILVFDTGGKFLVHQRGRQTEVQICDPLEADVAGVDQSGGAVRSPMHGKLVALLVKTGTRVVKGQRLAVVEAMKMEHALTAPFDGVAADVTGSESQQIAQGAIIAIIKPDTSGDNGT